MKLVIQSWCAWQSDTNGTAKSESYHAGEYTCSDGATPALENIPAMQKRRLSKLARIVFGALDGCGELPQQNPVIFSSQMGEIQRTQGILEAIAAGAPVSPAAFSLSVHNSVGGLWSLLRNNQCPMISLSPVVSSPVAALVEAAGILAEERYTSVCVVFYSEVLPAFYTPFLGGPQTSYAIALQLINPQRGEDSHSMALDLEQLPVAHAAPRWRSELELLKLLNADETSLLIAEPQATWRLGRAG